MRREEPGTGRPETGWQKSSKTPRGPIVSSGEEERLAGRGGAKGSLERRAIRRRHPWDMSGPQVDSDPLPRAEKAAADAMIPHDDIIVMNV